MVQELNLKVKEIIPRTYNVQSFRLELDAPLEFKAGQFMKVILGEGKDLEHYLSFSNSPTEKGYIEFTKKISDSKFSHALCALKAGDNVKVQAPFGKFTLEGIDAPKIAFLSGGIGITPIRSMMKYAADANLGKDMVLLYANRTIKDIAFRDDLNAIQRQYPRLKVVHVLCESEPGFKCSVGVINSEIVKGDIPDYLERKFFLCGPPGMVEAMKKILADELALPKEYIITENFAGY
jgi:ferredoxin-NADP reductase